MWWQRLDRVMLIKNLEIHFYPFDVTIVDSYLLLE